MENYMSLKQFGSMSSELVCTGALIAVICNANLYFASEISSLLAAKIAFKYTNNTYVEKDEQKK
jgi:hypothetical protein